MSRFNYRISFTREDLILILQAHLNDRILNYNHPTLKVETLTQHRKGGCMVSITTKQAPVLVRK